MFVRSILYTIIVSVFSLVTGSSAQEPEGDTGKTLSPYFLINSDDPAVDRLPLLATSAKVNIAGVIADVKVTQSYKNDGRKPIEAIYVFPASTRAAVYAMRMTIGKRTIVATIKEKQQARVEYETAKQQGKSASLLEQQRPNVFQMNVANIMPGDTIKVELSYTELLVPVNNIYEFVYPTVVGPRYSNKPEAGAKKSDTWTQNPYLHAGEKPSNTFDITAGIQTGMPIQEMTCPTHKVAINYDGPAAASVKLDNGESTGGNRDFILKYRLAGDAIESGLLLYKGEKENFFLCMVQPPRRVATAQIPRREYIFIVDVSGSMNGFPLDISKTLLKNLIGNLRPTDCFNVVLFAGGSTVMAASSVPATSQNIQKAIDVIDRQQGGGGTELLPALHTALNLPHAEGTSRSVVIATDGYVDVEPEAFELIRNNLNKANMFAFGIGSSVNRLIIEGMAHVGGGEPFVVTNPSNAKEAAEKFREYIQSPVLTQIKCVYKGFDAYDVEPISIPDVLAARPIIIFGKWRGAADGTISLTGYTGGSQYSQHFNAGQTKVSEANAALRYLWARSRIAMLGDFNQLRADDAKVKEITNLGLNYNLLTAYTSFVAVDNEVRNKDGKSETVKQALPMPEGVSDLAVGGSASQVQCAKSGVLGMVRSKSMGAGIGYGAGFGGSGYSAPAPACLAAPEQLKCEKSKESRQLVYDAVSKDDEKKTPVSTLSSKRPNLPTSEPSSITVSGKTILYFWTRSSAHGVDEIKAIIGFAQKNPGVTVVIVNLDGKDSAGARKTITGKLVKPQIPANVTFVFDTVGVMGAKFGVPTNPHTLPVTLFMENGAEKKSVHGNLGDWNDDAKVMGNFIR
jgi:Ca-activated chloride channel homolog